MPIKIQCMTEKLIVITIKLDYSKVPSKSTVPTYDCLSVQLCSDLVSASSVSLSSSLVACLVLSYVVIYSFILQTNDFVIFVLYIKLYHSENESRSFRNRKQNH